MEEVVSWRKVGDGSRVRMGGRDQEGGTRKSYDKSSRTFARGRKKWSQLLRLGDVGPTVKISSDQ